MNVGAGAGRAGEWCGGIVFKRGFWTIVLAGGGRIEAAICNQVDELDHTAWSPTSTISVRSSSLISVLTTVLLGPFVDMNLGMSQITNPFAIACLGGDLLFVMLVLGLIPFAQFSHESNVLFLRRDLGESSKPGMSSIWYSLIKSGLSEIP